MSNKRSPEKERMAERRDERLAAELRTNLKRRKAKERASSAQTALDAADGRPAPPASPQNKSP